MKTVVAAFNQEKALVGAFSVITNLRMELFEALVLITVLREAHLDWLTQCPAVSTWVGSSSAPVQLTQDPGDPAPSW